MNGTTTIAEFRDAVLDPAKRAHYRLAWLSTVDHKRIAVLYMLTALVFFVIAGVEALFMIGFPILIGLLLLFVPIWNHKGERAASRRDRKSVV